MRTKGPEDVKGGRINDLGCAEDRGKNLESLGWIDDSKGGAIQTKQELEVEKEKRQWQADLSVP